MSKTPPPPPQATNVEQAHHETLEVSRRNLVRSTAAVAGMAAIGARLSSQNAMAAPAHSSGERISAQGDIQTGVELSLPFLPYGQPVTLDPHRTGNWGPFWTLFPHVWSGLLRFDQNGAVEPDLAESVTPNSDLTVWTAKLRQGVTFASGRAITAGDFLNSWKRALASNALSPMSSFMEPVKGFADYTSGKSIEIGFKATDSATLEITLAAPMSSFPAFLATFVWAVLDGNVLQNPDVKDPFLADAGAGAWRFTELVDDDHLTMEPNPHHWEDPSPSLTKVRWMILSGDDAETIALQQYGSNSIASADVPLSQYDAANGNEALKPELQTIGSQGSTLAIGLDFNQPPFDDVRVRRAVAASIDRGAWANDVWKGSYVPASAFTSPITATIAGYTPPEGIGFNPDQAKSSLTDAKFNPSESAIDIVYYQPATDSAEDQQRHAALLKMIQDNSGIVIRHDISLTLDQISSQQTDAGGRQFDIVWWWPDVDSPAFLGTVAASTSPFMNGWFNWDKNIKKSGDFDPAKDSQSFDTLITDAAKSNDPAKRNGSYLEAEKLLLNNAVYVPLGYWVQRFVQKPWLQGTKQGPWSGRIPVRFDKDVVVRGKPG